MSISKEEALINGLLYDNDFSIEVLPYIKPEYFESNAIRVAFEELINYSYTYGSLPEKEELYIEVEKRSKKDLTGDEFEEFQTVYNDKLQKKLNVRTQWLRSLAEKFCKDRSLYLAISKSINIYEGEDKKLSRDAIPDLIKDALSISFDNTIGHDYFNDAEKAWEFYNKKENLVQFKIDILNKATAGGIPYKTLNAFMGGTNTFKTGFLCDLAASYLAMGHDVLYITLEMAEEKIRERIDANLTQLKISQVKTSAKDDYLKRIQDIHDRSQNARLFIKEYPATSANANHFRVLLKDLEIKKDFRPRIVIVDYLSICASIRVKDAGNLYAYNKAIAEELRGLAQEHGLILWTGMQTNRGGQESSDPNFNDTSESHGVPMTLDLLWAIITNDELEARGLIMLKQLKSRYEDKSKYRKIVLGVDRERMTINEPDTDTSGYETRDDNEILYGSNAKEYKDFKFD